MSISAELDNKNRILVYSSYEYKDRIKKIPGRRWNPDLKCWVLPLTLEAGTALRQEFGDEVRFSQPLIEWGRKERAQRTERTKLTLSDSAELRLLPQLNPRLYEFLQDRPFQLADVAAMASGSCINANEPGLGKTPEAIGAVYESGLIGGKQLVLTQTTALRNTWEMQLRRHIPDAVILTGDTPAQRRKAALTARETDGPCWLLLNFETAKLDDVYEHLFLTKWSTIIIDEFHVAGMSNTQTKFSTRISRLKAERCWAMSGTPIGGRPINLWAILHWIAPKTYTSKWNWARTWLDVSHNGYGWEIGNLKLGLTWEEFYKAHSHVIIRRTQPEAFPNMLEPLHIPVWCSMAPSQKKQYDKFYAKAELAFDTGDFISADGILAEYTRCKQLANATHKVVDGDMVPTAVSGKLDSLLDQLRQRGIGVKDEWSGQKAIVASQFTQFLYVARDFLESKGIKTLIITGDVTGEDRADAVRLFQEKDRHQVILLATKAGGVSITLDRADSCHILDETWNPDDQKQVWGRLRPMLKSNQVAVYTYRSRDTIDEYIYQTTQEKEDTNLNLMDRIRMVAKAAASAS